MNTFEPLAVRAGPASALIGIGRSTLLDLTYGGEIPSYKVGRARFWRVADLQDWVESQGRPGEVADCVAAQRGA